MQIGDIVSERTKLDEFHLGKAQSTKISFERLKELGLDVTGGWHPYGNNDSEWTFSQSNMIDLLDEAMTEFSKYQLRMSDDEEVNKFKSAVVNYLKTDGTNARKNISNVFKKLSDDTEAKIKHNEALGLMLNLLYSIQNSIADAQGY